MNTWLCIDLLAFAAGAFMLLILTPVFRLIARQLDFMDKPAANHKGHRKATPLLGGAAMFTGWILALLGGTAVIAFRLIPAFDVELLTHFDGFKMASGNLLFIVLGALGAVLLGLIDDKFALSAKTKFGGQFLVALIAVLGGNIRIHCFIECSWCQIALTVFWIMLMMNSINFFDNMDGLAAGTIAIAMGFFCVIAALNGQYFVAVLTALNCGVCCGFWFYNAAPASIFMGDSGSHFIGYLAAISAACVTYFDRGYSLSRFPILIPLMILALPLFDTAMVVAIRIWHKKPFWIGDHNHISHRFVRMGLSRPAAVMLVHLLALVISLGTLPVYWGDFQTAAVIVAQTFLLLIIITLLQFKLEERPDAREK